MVGKNGLKNIFNPKYQDFYRPFIAHELGHYYFGTVKDFNTELGDMISEGFSEYMSLQLTKEVIGEDIYDNKINGKIENLINFKPKPFSQIKSDSEYKNRQLFVYDFAPIIFIAIEKEIGKEKMWNWMRNLLISKTVLTDYAYLKNSLIKTINNTDKSNLIIENYFKSNKSLENALKKIRTK